MQTRIFQLTLTFIFGLLLTAVLAFVVNTGLARAGKNDLNPETAESEMFDLGPQEAEVISPTESLFDRIFAQRRRGVITYDIPFPFAALTQRIASHLAQEEKVQSPLQILIPLGRSLQRYVAKPEYFKYPRVIVAVDGEPATGPNQAGILLRDRLYLGYQEKANAIEVISYNPNAGQFEFQVVSEYGPGLNPIVSYANRALCTACHQNQGPIWSEPPWEETNANPRIGKLLQEQSRSFHGVPSNLAFQGTDIAFRIASSIERANLFASHQQLWQRACGESVRCRAGLFVSMLQYRLSGNRGYDGSSNSLESFKDGWRELWPKGLPIQDPHIPNRDPLTEVTDIFGEPEPLQPRPSKISINPSDVVDVEGVIAGLSGFLAKHDIQILDDYLFETNREAETTHHSLKAACAFTKTDLGGWALQIRFSCGNQDHDGISLEGQFYVERGKATHGTIERLIIGPSEELIKLTISGPEIVHPDSSGELVFALKQSIGGSIHARLTDGQVLENLTLRWDELAAEKEGPSEELRRHPDNGISILSIVDDLAPLRTALIALVQQTEIGVGDAFSEKPIRREALMQALFAQMGIKPYQRILR
jgi:hypothetical protein